MKDQTRADALTGGLGRSPVDDAAPALSAAGAAGAGGAGGPMFGTLPNPCGPGDGKAKPATDTGVTATEIHVSTISDPGGPQPGLNQSVHDTMRAFAQWCNSFGGINGRRLVVDLKDARILDYKGAVLDACDDSFALVGGVGVLDAAGAQDAVDCGLVNVPAAAVSAEVSGSVRVYQPLPVPPNRFLVGPAQWVKRVFPDAPDRAGAIWSNYPPVEVQSRRLREGYESQGYRFVYRRASALIETNWGPLVVSMKDEGVRYLTLTSTFEQITSLQKEMASQGWHPEVTELETNFYDRRYPAEAKNQGADTTATFIRLPIWPFEEADANPAMRQYLDLLARYAPGAESAELGVQSWSAGLLFATAANRAGAALTRDSLVAELDRIHSWTGGGLHGPSDPAAAIPTPCFVMTKVQDGGFARAYPLPDRDAVVYRNDTLAGMACPKEAIVDLKGDYGQGARAGLASGSR